MQKLTLLLVLLGFVLAGNAHSQSMVVKLWPNEVPGAILAPDYVENILPRGELQFIEKISSPEMLVYLAPAKSATKTAMLVCPGGGYKYISIVNEGYAMARWLNEQGINAFILKYRLPSDAIMKDKKIGPLQDVQEAMRIIRRNSSQWNIDPAKVGVMGFSAGGHLASTLCTHYSDKVYEASDGTRARPDFSVLVYPVISMDDSITHSGSKEHLLGTQPDAALVVEYSNELQVTKDTPPAFLVHATDDTGVKVENTLNYYLALKKNKITAEMHIYQKGGHGFGLGKENSTESSWPASCIKWLKVNGWL